MQDIPIGFDVRIGNRDIFTQIGKGDSNNNTLSHGNYDRESNYDYGLSVIGMRTFNPITTSTTVATSESERNISNDIIHHCPSDMLYVDSSSASSQHDIVNQLARERMRISELESKLSSAEMKLSEVLQIQSQTESKLSTVELELSQTNSRNEELYVMLNDCLNRINQLESNVSL